MMQKYKYSLTNKEHISKIDQKLLSEYLSFWGNSSVEDIMDMKCSRLSDYQKLSSDLINEIDICYKSSRNGIILDKKNIIENMLNILGPFREKSIFILDIPVATCTPNLKKNMMIQLATNEFEKANKCKEEISLSKKISIDAYHKFLRLGRRPEVVCHPLVYSRATKYGCKKRTKS